jgi:hypothetical protein
MRYLLDRVALPLAEDVGLANRKPGEKFKNAAGDIVTFQKLDPDNENFWESATNPTLTFKERIRKRMVALQTTETLGYKFGQNLHKESLMNF